MDKQQRDREGGGQGGTRRKKSGGRGGLYRAPYASTRTHTRICARGCHGSCPPPLLSPIRPFVRRVSQRTVGTFVRLFVMTVDETMTYFSGFHSQRGPRLFHSRFLAAPRPSSAPRPWPREDPRTDARAFLPCLGCNITTFLLLLLLCSFIQLSLFHRCSIFLLSFSLSLCLSTSR